MPELSSFPEAPRTRVPFQQFPSNRFGLLLVVSGFWAVLVSPEIGGLCGGKHSETARCPRSPASLKGYICSQHRAPHIPRNTTFLIPRFPSKRVPLLLGNPHIPRCLSGGGGGRQGTRNVTVSCMKGYETSLEEALQTPNPKPQTLNPKPQTLNPKP